jgi:hypothetical protein
MFFFITETERQKITTFPRSVFLEQLNFCTGTLKQKLWVRIRGVKKPYSEQEIPGSGTFALLRKFWYQPEKLYL